MRKIKVIATSFFFCLTIVFIGARSVFAQPVEQGTSNQLQIPTTSQSVEIKKVTGFVTVINKSNNRYLGNVKLTIDGTVITTPTTPDPPSAEGFKLDNLTATKHEIIAERAGYVLYDENITVPADKQNFSLKIALDLAPGTTVVNDQYFQQRYGQNYQGYPNTYPPTGVAPVYNPYTGGYSYQNTGTQPQLPYQGSTCGGTQGLTCPVGYSCQSIPGSVIGTCQITPGAYNPATGTINPVTQPSYLNPATQPQYPYQGSTCGGTSGLTCPVGYSCQSTTGIATGTCMPTNGAIGSGVQVQITPNISIGLQFGAQNSGIGLGTGAGTGTGTGSPQYLIATSSSLSLNNGFTVVRDSQSGNYYLVNQSYPQDYRLIHFVDSGNGQNGIAFVSMAPENGQYAGQTYLNGQNQNLNNQAGWFITTYVKDQNGNLTFNNNTFYFTNNNSLAQYQQNLSQQVTAQSIGTTTTASTTSSSNSVDLSASQGSGSTTVSSTGTTSSCIPKSVNGNVIQFCFGNPTLRQDAQAGKYDTVLNSIATIISNNIQSTRDTKGNPNFVTLIPRDDYFWTAQEAGTEAASCPGTVNSGNTSDLCYRAFAQSFTTQELNAMNSKTWANFIALKPDIDLTEQIGVNVVNHEWSHIYDYTSTSFKGTARAISLNSNYVYSNIFNTTQPTAQSQLRDLPSPFVLSDTLKQSPLCVYNLLVYSQSINTGYFTSQTTYNKTPSLVIDRPEELFAYSFVMYKNQKEPEFAAGLSQIGAPADCATTIGQLNNQFKTFFK